MILIIRGHIRNSFKNNQLLNFIKQVYLAHPNLSIYIHTWNVFANTLSWRNINENTEIVTEEKIYNYFLNLKHLIKHIIIDDDSKIQLVGNLNGNVSKGKMPILGWKNYWYGKYKIINYLSKKVDVNETIVNFRFDIFDNSNSFSEQKLLKFICNQKFTKNKFMFDTIHTGIDNIYMGNINTMYKLIYTFAHHLDYILSKSVVYNQENLVFIINDILFEKKLKPYLVIPSFIQPKQNDFHIRNFRTFF
jgi:hypothetical protein